MQWEFRRKVIAYEELSSSTSTSKVDDSLPHPEGGFKHPYYKRPAQSIPSHMIRLRAFDTCNISLACSVRCHITKVTKPDLSKTKKG